MLVAPYAALPLYVMFGLRKQRRARLATAWPGGTPEPAGAVSHDPWVRLSNGLGLPAPALYHGLVIDADGYEARNTVLHGIDSASRSIDLATFTFADDALGAEIGRCLAAAARRGVIVRVLIDGFGVWLYRHRHLDGLRRAGVQIAFFSPPFDWRFRARANQRNHRKMLLIDSQTAWMGGRNLAAPYFVDGHHGPAWTDLSFQVDGPIVSSLTMLFERDWASALRRPWTVPRSLAGSTVPGAQALLIPSGPEYADDAWHAMLVWSCHAARERIAIATPYFVPDPELLNALVCALRRGVRVELIVPSQSNHRLADWARGRAVRDLQQAGGTVLTTPIMTHAKLVVIDQTIAFAGSANMDARSLFINHELMLGLRRASDVIAMGQWFDALATRCSPHHARPLTLRRDLKEGLAQWLTFQL